MAQFTQNQRYKIIVKEIIKSNSGEFSVLFLTRRSSLLFLPSSKFWPVDVAILVHIIIFQNIVNYAGIVFSIDKSLGILILAMLAMVMIFIFCKDSK